MKPVFTISATVVAIVLSTASSDAAVHHLAVAPDVPPRVEAGVTELTGAPATRTWADGGSFKLAGKRSQLRNKARRGEAIGSRAGVARGASGRIDRSGRRTKGITSNMDIWEWRKSGPTGGAKPLQWNFDRGWIK